MKSGKVVLGVLAGIAAGAALGILLAPDKGSETRRKISKKGTDSIDGLKEKIDEFTDTLNEKFENLKKGAADFVSKGKASYDELKKEAKNGTV